MSNDWTTVLGKAVGHAAAYRESLPTRPHAPRLGYHEMRERLGAPLPETGTEPAAIIDELAELCDPGLMSITGPRFFGWVMGSSALPGVAADVLVSAWGQNNGYQTPTPAMAALEEVVERWLTDILDLPRESSIGFSTGATVANAICLAAARTRVLLDHGWDPDADGLFGAPPVEVLIGADAHSSVFSALQLIGFGYNRVTRVPTDDQGRMSVAALRGMLGADQHPRIVIAQAGQINTGAFDDFAGIVEAAGTVGAWVHVDGAFGLWARSAPGLKHLTAGIEGAHSWVTDGHKWLQAPYDTGFAIVRDREAHQRSMNNWASYLPVVAQGDRVPSAFVPELSRRARATPVWAMLKSLGRQGVAELVERNCAEAHRFAERLAAEPGISVLNDVVLNQVIVEFGEGDAAACKAATEAVIAAVQQDGTMFAAGAGWRGHWVLRLSVSSAATTMGDIDQSADAIIAAWRKVRNR
ncbi:MAG TPA: aminotransferase class V-fold PLP-dependent enzyme [Devosia sp.]|nr:aminotransferase class V-fold PLP-dependent enzyme [Devosia sp.]